MLTDLKSAWRRLRSAPAFTLTAILTLALAIGANTAVFSIADALLFRPLPYGDPDRVFMLQMQSRETGEQYEQVLLSDLEILRENHTGISEIGLSGGGAVRLTQLVTETAEGAETVPQMGVTPNFFDVLGVTAYRGRTFLPDDGTASSRAAMLAYNTWLQRFGGDESVVGSTVAFGGTSLDIVGVLPPDFVFPSLILSTTPISIEVVRPVEPPRPGEQGGVFRPVVRLPEGMTREQAQAEIETLFVAIAPEGTTFPVLKEPQSVLFSFGRPVAGLLLAAAGLVLLIGCSNLAIMLLVRGQKNLRETGVRAALGASRSRLMVPILMEACLIGVAGAALALTVTTVAFDLLIKQVPSAAIQYAPVGVSSRVVLFSLAMGLLGGLIFSAVPAWRSTRTDSQSLILGREQRILRRGRVGRPLIAMQVALAVVLVMGAMAITREFVSVLNTPLGFDSGNVLHLTVVPERATGIERQDFYASAVEAIRQRGDVVSVGATAALPLSGQGPYQGLVIPGMERSGGGIYNALPGFFETVGIRLLQGRLLQPADLAASSDVAVVDESLAEALIPGGAALGSTFTNGDGKPFRVVGVVSNVPDHNRAAYIVPGDSTGLMRLVIKTRQRSEVAAREMRRLVGDLAPGRPITAVWWSDSIDGLTQYRNPRFQTLVLGGFGGLALGLTALGIFAVVAFSVAIRRKEMGIRMAVGAQPQSLVALILRQSLAPVVAGLAIGLIAANWSRALAESYFGEVELQDPATLVAAGLTVTASALLAAYLPARRAARVDAMSVLKAE